MSSLSSSRVVPTFSSSSISVVQHNSTHTSPTKRSNVSSSSQSAPIPKGHSIKISPPPTVKEIPRARRIIIQSKKNHIPGYSPASITTQRKPKSALERIMQVEESLQKSPIIGPLLMKGGKSIPELEKFIENQVYIYLGPALAEARKLKLEADKLKREEENEKRRQEEEIARKEDLDRRDRAFLMLPDLAREYINNNNQNIIELERPGREKGQREEIEVYRKACSEDLESVNRELPPLIANPCLSKALPDSVITRCTWIFNTRPHIENVSFEDRLVQHSKNTSERYKHNRLVLWRNIKIAGRDAYRFITCSYAVNEFVIPQVMLNFSNDPNNQDARTRVFNLLLSTILGYAYTPTDGDSIANAMRNEPLVEVLKNRRFRDQAAAIRDITRGLNPSTYRE